MQADIEFDTFACAAEAWHLRVSASTPVVLLAAASTLPPVLLAMFGSRMFDRNVLRLVAQGLGRVK